MHTRPRHSYRTAQAAAPRLLDAWWHPPGSDYERAASLLDHAQTERYFGIEAADAIKQIANAGYAEYDTDRGTLLIVPSGTRASRLRLLRDGCTA